MGDPVQGLDLLSVFIGWVLGTISGIIGAVAESYSGYLLENKREGRRERKELIDLALNWGSRGRLEAM